MIVGLTMGGQQALAIPNQMLNPHSDAAGDISYILDSMKSPSETNHFHLPLRDGEKLSISDDVDNYGLRSNKGWAAMDVWDNNLLRFEDTPQMGDGRNALLNRFGHGYIDAAQAPLYKFDANVPAAARTLLAESFTVWAAAAETQIAGKKSQSGKPLAVGLAFKEAIPSQAAQFEYTFHGNLQGSRNVYGEWVVSQDRTGGIVSAKNTMVFDSNPANFIVAPEGYTIKVKGTLGSTSSITRSVGWSFDKTPDPIEVDLQYIKEGEVFESLPGKVLGTNSDVKIPCDDKINFYEMDFFTIALHETGHILGLLHAPEDAANNIMRAKIENQASWNRTLHRIDNDSAFGAALLYSIPIPEPTVAGVAILLAIGCTSRHTARRRSPNAILLQ
jgi:hypothetical protein